MKLTLESLKHYCHEEGDCLLWKLGVNSQGKPQANLEGKPGQMVQRYVYTVLMGKHIPKGRRMTSRCGHKCCVSPAHLFASSYSAILKRSYAEGKRSGYKEYFTRLKILRSAGRLRLTPESVREIRASDETDAALARKYGVHSRTIASARSGESWRYVDGGWM